MDKCFDIGVIQSFVDGELASSRAEEVVRHLSNCDSCAFLVADIESDNELVFETLATELDYMVPTERLREKVFTAISDKETVGIGAGAASWFDGFRALLSGRLVTAFGALAIGFVALGSFVYYDGLEADASLASVSGPPTVSIPKAEIPVERYSIEMVSAEANEDVNVVRASTVTEPVHIERTPRSVKAVMTDTRPKVVKAVVAGPPIEAEPGYLQTISTLNRSVDRNKDFVLSPSERIEFEKNLAVVNNAISRMRTAVKNNPNDEGAKQVLNASYKSKIDLLSSVANRQETVATLD